MLKLGSMVTDKVTELHGMLTMYSYDMDKNVHYLFQPSRLNPETKQPVDTLWITETRIIGAQFTEIDLPIEVLGTEVTDKATNYTGTAINLYHHLNGCNHFGVKPKGQNEKTGDSIKAADFDIRRLKGAAIKEWIVNQWNKKFSQASLID